MNDKPQKPKKESDYQSKEMILSDLRLTPSDPNYHRILIEVLIDIGDDIINKLDDINAKL